MANKRYHPLTQSHGPSAALPSSMAYLRGGPRECDLIRTNCSLWSRKHAGTVSTWTARGSDLYLMPCGGTRPLPETPGPMGKHCCGCNSDVNSTKRVNGDISSGPQSPCVRGICNLTEEAEHSISGACLNRAKAEIVQLHSVPSLRGRATD